MCAPCGYVPNHPTGCQDYSAPHEAEAGGATSGPVQPSMPRMGRLSTICCGWDFLTAEDVLAHRVQH